MTHTILKLTASAVLFSLLLVGCTTARTSRVPIQNENTIPITEQTPPTPNTNIPTEPSNPGPTAPEPSPKVDTSPTQPTDLSRLHKNCSQSACPSSMQCVEYYGIAGGQGPTFSTCEIPCATDAQCPASTHCATIADGPGRVCS
jgi:hypothetical protein